MPALKIYRCLLQLWLIPQTTTTTTINSSPFYSFSSSLPISQQDNDNSNNNNPHQTNPMSQQIAAELQQQVEDDGVLSRSVTSLLLCLFDPIDRPRQLAYLALLSMPSPLSGYHSIAKVTKLINSTAMKMLSSPRSQAADTAALLLRLLWHKFVLPLGWCVLCCCVVFCVMCIDYCTCSRTMFSSLISSLSLSVCVSVCVCVCVC